MFQKGVMKLIGNKTIITIIYRIHVYDSIMCGYFCTGFIYFVLRSQNLLEYTNLFSPNELKRMTK